MFGIMFELEETKYIQLIGLYENDILVSFCKF